VDLFGRKKRQAKIDSLRHEYDKIARESHNQISKISGKVLDHPKYGRIGFVVPSMSFTGPDRMCKYCSECFKDRYFSHLAWWFYYCEKCLNVERG